MAPFVVFETLVADVEHVEDTLDMEPLPEPGGSARGDSGVAIPIRMRDIPLSL